MKSTFCSELLVSYIIHMLYKC